MSKTWSAWESVDHDLALFVRLNSEFTSASSLCIHKGKRLAWSRVLRFSTARMSRFVNSMRSYCCERHSDPHFRPHWPESRHNAVFILYTVHVSLVHVVHNEENAARLIPVLKVRTNTIFMSYSLELCLWLHLTDCFPESKSWKVPAELLNVGWKFRAMCNPGKVYRGLEGTNLSCKSTQTACEISCELSERRQHYLQLEHSVLWLQPVIMG